MAQNWVTVTQCIVSCLLAGLFGLLSNLFVIIVIVAYRPMGELITNLYLINQSLIDAGVATFLVLTTLLQVFEATEIFQLNQILIV